MILLIVVEISRETSPSTTPLTLDSDVLTRSTELLRFEKEDEVRPFSEVLILDTRVHRLV